jgi:hypothetical protein
MNRVSGVVWVTDPLFRIAPQHQWSTSLCNRDTTSLVLLIFVFHSSEEEFLPGAPCPIFFLVYPSPNFTWCLLMSPVFTAVREGPTI